MPLKKHLRRSLKRNIPLLIVIEFFAELRLYFPVAVLAFEALMGSYTMAMSIFSVVTIVTTMAEVPTGVLSDKWGRRGTLIAGSVCECIAVSLYSLAFCFPDQHIYLLYAGAIFYGLTTALFSGNNHAMVYESLDAYKRAGDIAKVLGRISSFGQIGLALSGIISGILIWHGFDYRILMLLTIPSILITVLLAVMTVEPPARVVGDKSPVKHMKTAAKLIIHNRKLRLLTMAVALQQGAGLSNYYFTPGFINTVWPAWMTPLFRTGQHFVGAVGFWFAGAITKRFTPINTLLFGTLIGQSVYGVALGIANFLSPFMMVFTQATYATSTTAERTIQQETFSNAQRATMGSLISFITGIVSSLFCLLMGWFSDMLGPATGMFVLFLGRAVVVDLIYVQLYRKHK